MDVTCVWEGHDGDQQQLASPDTFDKHQHGCVIEKDINGKGGRESLEWIGNIRMESLELEPSSSLQTGM